jgi:YbgC/YbaW family acyl-CoA thioester hydrolase
MAHTFSLTHRVAFSDTDMAGIMHFANFFRYMEMTEHAFFRSLGLSVHMEIDGRFYGWPRVQVSCDFKHPLKFEEEFEITLIVSEKRARSLRYTFEVSRQREDQRILVARGSFTVVCVSMDTESGQMRAVSIPEIISRRIEAAPVSSER